MLDDDLIETILVLQEMEKNEERMVGRIIELLIKNGLLNDALTGMAEGCNTAAGAVLALEFGIPRQVAEEVVSIVLRAILRDFKS